MHGLIESLGQLERVLTPIVDGRVNQAGFDTETTEVKEKRFTPWGTDTRFCGFSVSYDLYGAEIDLYVPVRHVPYDWRRPVERMRADVSNEGDRWADALLGVERVTSEGTWQDGADPNLPLDDVLALIQHMFNADGVEWLAQNWPFDTRMMLVEGITLPWERMEDTQALSVFTDPRPVDLWDDTLNDGKGGFVHGGHRLKHLGEVWCGIKPEQQAQLDQARRALGEGSSMLNDWSMLPLRTVIAPYACRDTRLLLKVAAVCRERPAYQEPQTRELLRLHKLERRHVAAMEQRGIAVNQELCLERGEAKRKEVEALVIGITELAGITLNLGHGETLATQLYDELGFPTYRGNRNTREATLKHVRTKLVTEQVPWPLTNGISSDDAIKLLDAILDYRKAFKELTSFYRPLTQFGETGRVHTTLSPIAARTTRYAAEKPNVMQMGKPKKAKTPEATYQNQLNSVRHLFQPGPDHCYGLYDYSGQEMRLMAHYALAIPSSFEYRFTWGCTMGSRGNGKYPPNTCRGSTPHGPKDDYKACQKFRHAGRYPNYSSRPAVMGLVEGFMGDDRAEFDPHNIMMETLARLGVELDRDKAKNIDFAIPYGVGIGKAADMIDSDTATAKRIISIFWDEAYTELGRVKQFISERLRNAGTESPWSHQEFIRTLHGARIYLADGFKGMNYVIQRSGRELLLKSIVSIGEYLEKHGLDHDGGWQLVMPIHDELMFRIHRDALNIQVSQDISRLMVEAGSESLIPMVVQPSVAYESWAVKEALPKDWGCDGVELYGRRDPWSE